MNEQKKYKIIKVEIYDDEIKIKNQVHSSSTIYQVVENFQVDYTILFKNKKYWICLQNEERSENIYFYSSFGMFFGNHYGVDDDFGKLINDMTENEQEEFSKDLILHSEKICEKKCKYLIEKGR